MENLKTILNGIVASFVKKKDIDKLKLDGGIGYTETDENLEEITHKINEKYIPGTLFMSKENPVGTGSFSLNRANNSVIGEKSFAEGSSTTASGQSSHAEGCSTTASGNYSHAEGDVTTASGVSSHAEGGATIASGKSSHAEGSIAIASGEYSHAEGINTTASTYGSHAEGSFSKTGNTTQSSSTTTINNTTYGPSHAEGFATLAKPIASHAEGYRTQATGGASHAEGYSTTASGEYAHAEGISTIASGSYSHTEGASTTASRYGTHAEGDGTTASANYSHAEGNDTTASGIASHAEGKNTTASGGYSHAEGGYAQTGNATQSTNTHTLSGGYFDYSHAEGFATLAKGRDSHAEGYRAQALSAASHAEGDTTTANAKGSHAEGGSTIASGNYSHTEGSQTIASGTYSHAEGQLTTASATQAHAEGYYSIASGQASHAEGFSTTASGRFQHVQGQYNVEDQSGASSVYADIIGNGTAASRKNIEATTWTGDKRLKGDVYVQCNDDSTGGTKLATVSDVPTKTSDLTNDSGFITQHQDISGKADCIDGTVLSYNADFAEIGEWSDGNPNNENRLGYFVSVDKTEAGITMLKATSTSDVRGVTMESPGFAANATTDKFDSDGNLLSKYSYVGFAGFVPVIDNGTCTVNGRCVSANDGTAIPSPNTMGYQIIDRIDDTHVLILVEPSADMLVRIKDDMDNMVTQASFNEGTFSFKNALGVEQFTVQIPIYNGEEL